ncbi:toxin VasX [Xenorhabdus stockiae]|uniref:toxin VasX n=1 Tax=Xenorhabdus stockiae TaxID=351614 RepID=UPI003CEB6B9F
MGMNKYTSYTDESVTKLDTDFKQRVDEINKNLPYNLDMDTVVRLCDVNIRPVYPVRYAYANFFGKTLEKAQLPPDIYTIMDQTRPSCKNKRDYVARVLRPGWIYVKEEGLLKSRGLKEGDMLIFKYLPETIDIKGKEGIIENFIQYERKEGNASWETLRPASGKAGLAYPFLSICKDVQKISIVYSEVPLSPYILKKIDEDKEYRSASMQLINLEDSDSPHAITATRYNFDNLIEDYKTEEIQFKYYEDRLSGPGLSTVNLGDLTTQNIYRLNSYIIMKKVESLLCPYYKDKGKIVILYDPVGYQRDILMAYSVLFLWRSSYISTYTYPISIGQFVEKISESDDPKIKKYFKECIDQDNWKAWWPRLNNPIKDAGDKLQEILFLYKCLFESQGISDQLGGLSHYFKNFFSLPINKGTLTVKDAEEFEVCCTLFSELIEPLTYSEEGLFALEHILGGKIAAETSSTWDVILNGMVNTLGHDGVDKEKIIEKLIQGINKTLKVTGNLMARFFVFIEEKSYKGVLKLHTASIKRIADKLIPNFMDVLGIEIKKGDYVELKGKQYYDFLKKTQETGVSEKIKKGMSDIEADLKKFTGRKVFNWAEKINKQNDNLSVKVSTIKLKRKELNFKASFLEYNNKTVSHLLGCGLSGVDLFMKSYTIYSLISMSGFDRNNPHKYNGQPLYFAATYMNNVIGGIIAAKGFTEAQGKILKILAGKINSTTFKSVLNSFSSQIVLNNNLITTLTSRGMIITSGAISGILSYYDAYNSFSMSNNEQGYSHVAIGTGAIMMATSWLLAGVLGEMTFGLSVLFWLGISSIIGGTIGAILFGRADLEDLLKNCFWGNGDKYAFWSIDEPRPSLDAQLKEVRNITEDIDNSYTVERQEFLNFFIRPILKIENNKKGKMVYNFTLPDFAWGESELYYEIFPSSSVHRYYTGPAPELDANLRMLNYNKAKNKFEQLMCREFSELISEKENGITTLTLEMDIHDYMYIDVFWYYKPQKGMISPLRYVWREKPKLENAIYGYKNEELR